MGTSIEERVFEYVRGASAAAPERNWAVVQHVIDLAHGDIDVLRRACRRCEQEFGADDVENAERNRILCLLRAATDLLAGATDHAGSRRAALVERLRSSPSPRLVETLAVLLAEEDLHISVAEDELLLAVRDDRTLIESACTLALEDFAPGLAAGDTRTITALSILEGACRRLRR